MYAQVIVDIASESVDRVFTYRVPEGMNIVRGMRVSVPFGPRSAEGYVLGLSDTAQLDESRIKAIRQPLEDYPALLPPRRTTGAAAAFQNRRSSVSVALRPWPMKLP